MELAGHECVGFCEFDKFAVAGYTAMHLMTEQEREYISTLPKNKRVAEAGKEEYRHGEWYANDIRRIFAEDIPKADCWCFGFPCQDISVAGKQLGFNGARSSLFFRVMRLVQDLEEKDRPTYLFIENVKNLLSVNGGTDFLKLLIALDESGYDAEWQVINSADYVPQNRERVFIIGHLRGRSTAKVFPIERADRENSVQIIGHREGFSRNMQVFSPDGITESLETGQGGGRGHYTAFPIFCDMSKSAGIQTYDKAFCLQARYNKGVCNRKEEVSGVCVPVLTPDRAEKRQNGRRFKDDGEPMFTLTGQDRHGIGIEIAGILRNVRTEYGKKIRKDYEAGKIDISRHKFLESEIREDGIVNTLSTVQKDNSLAVKVREGKEKDGLFVKISDVLTVYAVWYEKYQCYIAIRKLTPRECFRLQGWSEEYFDRAELVSSDSQLYKQAGNGVTVPVIYEIAKRMGVEK
jgi:DNA (cytosine-5)-methyltransferase 1